jgi:hypothetical protein
VYDEKGNQVKGASTTTYSKEQLNKGKEDISPSTLIGKDFRSKIPPKPGTHDTNYKEVLLGLLIPGDYTSITVNKIQRVGLGDPGKRS